jgi:hypothetical protein
MRRCLLLVALVAGLVRLHATHVALDAETKLGDAVAYDHGTAVLNRSRLGLNALIARVHEEVPGTVPIRVVLDGATCERLPVVKLGGVQYWLQYQLLPHPLSCDPDEPWQVYVAGEPPDGAELVAPGYAIVYLPHDRAARGRGDPGSAPR